MAIDIMRMPGCHALRFEVPAILNGSRLPRLKLIGAPMACIACLLPSSDANAYVSIHIVDC